MKDFYTSRDLAREIGQSVRTAERVLRERDPSHVGWWRLSRVEFEHLLAEVQTPVRRFGTRRADDAP